MKTTHVTKRYLSGSDRLSERSGRSTATSSLAPAPANLPPGSRTRSVSLNSLKDIRRTKPVAAVQVQSHAMVAPVRGQSQSVGHTVPGLNLSAVSSMVSSHKPRSSRSPLEEQLSAVQLPNLEIEQPRMFGDDTEAELAICPPSLGEDTINCSLDHSTHTTQTTQPTISTTHNTKVTSPKVTKKIVSGRSSAISCSPQHKHKVGKIPNYLKVRQTEWKEAEKKRISEIPVNDPDCPPGHRLLDKEEKEARIATMEEEQASLLHEVSNLPFSVDTRRVRIKRQQIEERLAQLEDR